jgi:hypothetical protein
MLFCSSLHKTLQHHVTCHQYVCLLYCLKVEHFQGLILHLVAAAFYPLTTRVTFPFLGIKFCNKILRNFKLGFRVC